jgi:aminopeptidase YwaD
VFQETLTKISAEASAERAFDHVTLISQFHRIQASPGYRDAARYCLARLLEASPEPLIIDYPAQAGVSFWQFPSFDEWSGATGILRITRPGKLAGKVADFEDCPMSLIQRSKPTPPKGLATEIVYAGEGRDVRDYRRAEGKIAICDAFCPHQVYDAALKAGVAGIILYKHRPLPGLRFGSGLQGIRQYNSFWWDEKDLFGFVLTPEDGDRIVSYLTSRDSKKHPVRARALVESETYPGTFEVVTSLIRGEEPGEVVLVAHLCHPKPSAGDNASGVAALLETHRVMAGLIERGDLPRPRYGIRFLIVPEMTGTFAFLSREHSIRKRLLLGLNLDMVGQRQDVTGSTLCIEAPPLSAPSFTPFLLEHFVRRAFTGGANPGGTSSLLSLRIEATPFSGGSDHYILSDPVVGVPTPMLIQWPDKFYHTSGDTPDRVSPDVLRRIVIAASAYAYTCALAGEEEMMGVAALAGRGLRKRVIDDMGSFATSEAPIWITPAYKANALLAYGKRALASIGKMLPDSKSLRARLKAEERALKQCVATELAATSTRAPGGKSRGRVGRGKLAAYTNLCVKRLEPGPVDAGAAVRRLSAGRRARYWKRVRKESRAYMMQTLALNWANGRRSIAEISRLVAVEIGYTNPEFLKFYFEVLEEAGAVEIISR